MDKLRIALVEDDAEMRARLQRVIAATAGLDCLKAAAGGQELLAWLALHEVDVLLVDLGLPDLSGLELIRRARRLRPAADVMVLTSYGDETHILQAFAAGAQGYLLKEGDGKDLAQHVRSLHAGGSPMSPAIARRFLVRWQASQPVVDADIALSQREREVLQRVARGFTYGEVAEQLCVSITTVYSHVRNLYAKLGVHNKTEAVFEARQTGLL